MVYNNNIPQPTDLISNSQAQILENFSQLDKQYGTAATTSGGAGIGDHVGFSNGSLNGYHIQVRFPNAATEPAAAGTVSAIFPLLNATTGQQELYFKNSSTEYGGAAKTLLTGPFTAAANGSCYLPGGIILKWGTFSLAAGVGSAGVTFAGGAFPANVWSVTFGSNVTGPLAVNLPIISPASLTTTGFTGSRQTGTSGGTYTYYYMAIGN